MTDDASSTGYSRGSDNSCLEWPIHPELAQTINKPASSFQVTMPVRLTTISVNPARAEKLRQVRDERDLSSMDAALDEVLQEVNAGA